MGARIVAAVLLFSSFFTTTFLGQTQVGKQVGVNDSPATTSSGICVPAKPLSSAQFLVLLQTVRDAWLAGQAEKVVGCFAPGAIFSLPPSLGVVGRESLLRVFGASQKGELPRSIEWHHVVFDPVQQIGAAEFSIQRRIPTHGVVIIKISGGLISNWCQYTIASDLTWEKFVGMNKF